MSWRSSRQTTVTLSTAESELAAAAEGARARVSIEALLSELDLGNWVSLLRTDSTSSFQVQLDRCDVLRGDPRGRTGHTRTSSGSSRAEALPL